MPQPFASQVNGCEYTDEIIIESEPEVRLSGNFNAA
jgi:hypothetical protein